MGLQHTLSRIRLPRSLRLRKRHAVDAVDCDYLKSELDMAVLSVKSGFDSIGMSIGQIDSCASSLRADCHKLLELAGGQQGGNETLRSAAAVLDEPMDFIEGCLGQHDRVCDLMRECERRSKNLLALQDEMITALEPLKFMLVLFKIEAAHLTVEHQETFLTVSEEIQKLHQLVHKTFAQNAIQLTHARAVIVKALKHLNDEHREHGNEVEIKRKEIIDAMSSLDRQLSINAVQDTELNFAAERFQSAIGSMVGALQYSDIISQRCHKIAKDLANPPRDVSPQAWVLLQTRQIEAAAKEIRKSSTDVRNGLQAIIDQAEQLDEISLAMQPFDQMTASADGMVQVLLGAIESTEAILQRSDRQSAESREAIEPVRVMTDSLSTVVLEVSINIHIIALNAQVRSIQVGAGSGLEVLAAQTASTSTILQTLGNKTSTEINQLGEAVHNLVDIIDGDREGNALHARQLAERSEPVARKLHSLRDKTFTILALISEKMQQVNEIIKTDQAGIQQLPSIAARLELLARRTREKARVNTLAPDKLDALENELAKHLDDSEKTVHTTLRHDVNRKTDVWGTAPARPGRRVAPTAPAAAKATVAPGEIELF